MTRLNDTEMTTERVNGMTIRRRAEVPLDSLLAALKADGEILKTTRKSTTRRVNNWVVKSTGHEAGVGILKRTFFRARYRRGWRASLHLAAHGIHVAQFRAFVEFGRWGVITKNALVCEYIDEACDVEAYADRLIAQRATDDEVHAYLARLADAINALAAVGAFHADLAGKNILTRDGQTFFFVDLECVILDRPYSIRRRLRNHVQLYDSFCDRWDDRFLEPFLTHMLPETVSSAQWLTRVRRMQSKRRARTEAAWHRQGRL